MCSETPHESVLRNIQMLLKMWKVCWSHTWGFGQGVLWTKGCVGFELALGGLCELVIPLLCFLGLYETENHFCRSPVSKRFFLNTMNIMTQDTRDKVILCETSPERHVAFTWYSIPFFWQCASGFHPSCVIHYSLLALVKRRFEWIYRLPKVFLPKKEQHDKHTRCTSMIAAKMSSLVRGYSAGRWLDKGSLNNVSVPIGVAWILDNAPICNLLRVAFVSKCV